jgi:hypothetical protein
VTEIQLFEGRSHLLPAPEAGLQRVGFAANGAERRSVSRGAS